jgi:AraC-like DNA-binding protein
MVNYKKYLDIEIFEGEISKHQYPWHFHDSYTFVIVEKGSIIYELKDKILLVGEAEALIIEPFKVHRNIISKHTIYKAFFLPQEYFEVSEKNKIVTQLVHDLNIVAKLTDFFNKIKLNYTKTELKEIILGINELINQPQGTSIDKSTESMHSLPNLNSDLSIKELAQEAHLSKFHFQRKFKKKYGLTIGQLKQQEKTIKAKTLLENGSLSTNAAYELGFFDQSHFIKYFKKMWATTPKNFM